MNLLSGLEQFGITAEAGGKDIFADEERKRVEKEENEVKKAPVVKEYVEKVQPETDFLLTRHIRCTVCEKVFDVKTVKNARVKRLQPDFDLRPRFQFIDTLKYDVYSCPYCGYAAMSRYFEHLTKGQIALIKEAVCANYAPTTLDQPETYSYELAISRYKLALYNAMIKHGKTSEKAYTCLKISWLYRSMADEMPETTDEEKAKKAEIRELQEQFYREAYDGFQKAMAKEDFPMCGMDSHTMDYMLAAIACHFKEFSYASKSVSNIITSSNADRRIKDRALELKEYIITEIKKNAGK
ncbi:MAG: DUF2225 domain-containing protein [Lachnospiraceae bacterium]|nr:DUF2225 domain-containing protein [Lachnospiraceae bacterium]